MAKDADAPRQTVPAKCAACDGPLESPLFCSTCRRLYPADGLNFFELLGLRPDYDVDASELRRRYFELAREIHPDRVDANAPDVQRLSMQASARVNQAFDVLGDPVQRAEYLLELAGGQAAADDKRVPQEVLVDTLTLREQIEEAQGADNQAALEDLQRQVRDRFDTTLEQIAALARQLPGDEQTRAALRGKLNAIRYYRRMREQL